MNAFTEDMLSLIFDFDIRHLTAEQRAAWHRHLLKAFDVESIDVFDVHSLMAWRLFGRAPAEVTAAQRRHAKQINYSIIYGASRPHLLQGGYV